MYYDKTIKHIFSRTLITVLVKIGINVHHQHFSNYYQCCYLYEIYLIRRCMLSNIDFFYFPTIHGFEPIILANSSLKLHGNEKNTPMIAGDFLSEQNEEFRFFI